MVSMIRITQEEAAKRVESRRRKEQLEEAARQHRREVRNRKCERCHDSGRIATGPADPDDPWSAMAYRPCDCEAGD